MALTRMKVLGLKNHHYGNKRISNIVKSLNYSVDFLT